MRYVYRVLMLPFVWGLISIGFIRNLIEHSIGIVKYGGEYNTYDKNTKNRISNLLDYLKNAETTAK